MAASLEIIIIATNEARWLRPCLSSVFEHAGGIELDVIVVDNESTDGTRALVGDEFPDARVIWTPRTRVSRREQSGRLRDVCSVHSLLESGHRDSRTALSRSSWRHDRCRLSGLSASSRCCGRRGRPDDPSVPDRSSILGGRAWVRSDFLSGLRGWASASSTSTVRSREDCDWTSGSFMFVRREALEVARTGRAILHLLGRGRLCLRIRQAGWGSEFSTMTIRHHTGKAGISARMTAQSAFARRHT